MRCPNCGSLLKEDAKFCGKCGHQIRQVQPRRNPSDSVNVPKRHAAQPQNRSGKYSAAQATHKTKKKESSGTWGVGLLIALIVVLLCVIIFVIIPMVKSNDTKNMDASNAMAAETNISKEEISDMNLFSKPEDQVLDAIAEGNYEYAKELLTQEKIMKNCDNLVKKLSKRISTLEKEYKNDKIAYEDVISELTGIGQLGITEISEELVTAQEDVYEIYLEKECETVYLCTSQTSMNYQSNFQTTTTWNYDNHGRLTKYANATEYFDTSMKDNNRSQSYSYTYDLQGNLDSISMDSDEQIWELDVFYTNGLISKMSGYFDGVLGSYQFRYDESGKLIARDICDEANNVESTMTLKYNDAGSLQETEQNLSGFITKRKYDENGNMIENSLAQNTSDGLHYYYRNVFDYNEEGNVIYQATYSNNEDTPAQVIRYEYDKNGRISAMGMGSGEEIYYVQSEWNEETKILTMDDGHSGGVVYEYDGAGNCIRSSTYADGELISQSTSTFIALKLPRDYKKPDLTDPYLIIN